MRVCPKCKSESKVVNTRLSGSLVWRRRVCNKCGKTWSTYEIEATQFAYMGLITLKFDNLREETDELIAATIKHPEIKRVLAAITREVVANAKTASRVFESQEDEGSGNSTQ